MANHTANTSHHVKVWTPSLQHLNSTIKPIKLLELGENERGKFVRVEFDDESSRPLYLAAPEESWHPLFDSLDAESQRKIRRHWRAYETEQLPDGNVKRREYVSFQSEVTTKRGAYVKAHYFDVPPQSYFDGAVGGILAGKEFLDMVKLKSGPDMRLRFMIEELAAACKDPYVYRSKEKSRRSTAESFLSVLDAALIFAAKNGDFSRMIEAWIKSEQDGQAFDAVAEAQEKAELVERLRRGREAKRNAVQAPDCETISSRTTCSEVAHG